MSVPAPTFTHLIRLSDDTGLFEHARHAVVRREHGYCTDDVARGLVVTCREPDPDPVLVGLAECYLTFLTHAQDHTGAFHNRMSYARHWLDEPSLGDWWGRALWGLGTAAARSPAPWLRLEARTAFEAGAARRSPMVHAMAFAGLGAAEVLRADPTDKLALALLADAATAVLGSAGGSGGPAGLGSAGGSGAPALGAGEPGWDWPTERLSYASAALAEVVILAGYHGGDSDLLASGVRMLTWLYQQQQRDGRLSVVPVAGWHRGTPRERYDQQSIEVAALADACATPAYATGDPRWYAGVAQAAAWFGGDNDAGTPMWDQATGGGYDGLTEHGINLNQGAESTMAFIATMQQARRLP